MQTPCNYDTSEESNTDAVCQKCHLMPIMGFKSIVIFGMTWDEQTFTEKKHKLQMYVDDLDQQLLFHTKPLASFPAPPPTPAWIVFSTACREEGLATFVTLPCLDGMSNYELSWNKQRHLDVAQDLINTFCFDLTVFKVLLSSTAISRFQSRLY